MSGGTERPSELGSTYDDHFYADLDAEVRGSAETVVPIVVDLLHPASVLDVGCGRGTWLHVFAQCGVGEILGLDGPHIAAADLEIPPDAFVGRDLTQPFDLGRRFDLVVSLEVAEHLPPHSAAAFVASLVAHAPAVLFSAAVPFQGGAGHVNERWPSYWAELFAAHGFDPVDVVRPAVWADERVAFWYAQNTLLYVARSHAGADLVRERSATVRGPLDLVHPLLHERDHAARRRPSPPPSLRRALRDVRAAALRAVRDRASARGGRSS
ncbi:MAG TPA: methyltransferase domain-containing protein [Acidimicrobiia bacterium]